MSASLCIHVDGSRVATKDKRRRALGWAVVGEFEGTLIEHSGAQAFAWSKSVSFSGHYEHVAFINGVLLAQRLGVPLQGLTILCDDEVFGYAPTWMHPGNLLPHRRDLVTSRLKTTIETFFTPDVEPMVLQAFEAARIVKIKGHQFEVYQERADYLAKHSGKRALGLETEAPVPFDDWLNAGLQYYVSPDLPPQTWHAPFVPGPVPPQDPSA